MCKNCTFPIKACLNVSVGVNVAWLSLKRRAVLHGEVWGVLSDTGLTHKPYNLTHRWPHTLTHTLFTRLPISFSLGPMMDASWLNEALWRLRTDCFIVPGKRRSLSRKVCGGGGQFPIIPCRTQSNCAKKNKSPIALIRDTDQWHQRSWIATLL